MQGTGIMDAEIIGMCNNIMCTAQGRMIKGNVYEGGEKLWGRGG